MEYRPGEGGEGLWGEVPAHIQQGSFALWRLQPADLGEQCSHSGKVSRASLQVIPPAWGLQHPSMAPCPWHSPFLALQAQLGLALLCSAPRCPVYLCYIYMSIL